MPRRTPTPESSQPIPEDGNGLARKEKRNKWGTISLTCLMGKWDGWDIGLR